MPKPRGPYRKKFKSKFENSEQRQIASWTNDKYQQNWLYLYHAREKKIEAENQFIKTKNIKYLRKAKIHNFKAKQILFEGINLYEETVEELQLIVKQIALELYPQEKELIDKKITRTAIEELQLYSSRGESPENPIEITQQQSDFKRKFDELLDTPKINKDPTVSLEELTQPPLSEEEKQQRLERLQVLKEEIERMEKEIKAEEEREAEEHQRRLRQFEEIIRRQKLKKLEEELEKTEERQEKIKKEILKLTKKVNFNEDVEIRDTHTRDETPEIEKQDFIQVIGDRIEEEPTREELEKEFEEESNQLHKG